MNYTPNAHHLRFICCISASFPVLARKWKRERKNSLLPTNRLFSSFLFFFFFRVIMISETVRKNRRTWVYTATETSIQDSDWRWKKKNKPGRQKASSLTTSAFQLKEKHSGKWIRKSLVQMQEWNVNDLSRNYRREKNRYYGEKIRLCSHCRQFMVKFYEFDALFLLNCGDLVKNPI